MPNSPITAAIEALSMGRLTASSLNSVVCARFGIFFISSLSNVTLILRHPWQTNFQGNLTALYGVATLNCNSK